MRGRLLLLIPMLIVVCNQLVGQRARTATPAPQQPDQIEFMDPDVVYSFRGLDGNGFLTRKPLNIPSVAYDKAETGLVILIFAVSPAGLVKNIRLEPGQEGFATAKMIQAANQAVEQWRFNPLPPEQPQEDEEVRVLIQFNHAGSGRLYSSEGNFIIEGIDNRLPIEVPMPDYELRHEGIVIAEITIDPKGNIAWIDRYYGERPSMPVNPHLGIITHQAVKEWHFSALPASIPQEDQKVKVICRYFHWPEPEDSRPDARLSSMPRG